MRRLWLLLLFIPLLGATPTSVQLSSQQELQSKANHWIKVENAEDAGGCSATAISRHALLTARHCDLGEATVRVDDAEVAIVPDKKIFDQYDGMILVFSGWDFQDFVPLEAKYDTPWPGETLYLFGNPRGIRNIYRVGVLGGVTVSTDDEIAPGATIFIGTMNVEPGDSGSSIYAADGRRVGILTYGIFNGKFCGFFPLSFTAEQIREAE